MSGRLTRGTWRAAALAAAVVSPPWVPRPFQGGFGPAASLAGLRPSAGRWGGGGEGGEGGGEGDSPQSPPGPLASPPGGRGGAAWWFRSRGAGCGRGGRTLPPPPSALGCQTLVQAFARAPYSPHRGGGAASAGEGSSGQRSAVSALRGSGPPPALVAPAPSPTGGGARPSAASDSGGSGGRAPGRGPRSH